MYRQQRNRQDRINRPQSLDDLYERAKEHAAHKATVTFVSPETLMHLITVRRDFVELRRLVERHWELAQKEQGGSYSDRDLFLWSQALGWHETKEE